MGIAESYRGPRGKPLAPPRIDLEEALEMLRSLFSRTGVALAYLFGSHAREEARAASNIDMAVLLDCDRKELYASYRELMLGVRGVLGSERFDLLLLNNAPPTLKFEIVSQGRLIYSRDERALNEFEMDTIRRFQDTAYLRRVQNNYLRERARRWYSEERASWSDSRS